MLSSSCSVLTDALVHCHEVIPVLQRPDCIETGRVKAAVHRVLWRVVQISRRAVPALPCSVKLPRNAQPSLPLPAHVGAFAAPKCNNECAIAKRNAWLVDALGINTELREKTALVTYHDEVAGFACANSKFLVVVEKVFDEFVMSQKKTQVLPHMPPERKKFVHNLAAVYRMNTQMVDQEPHRSVLLLRRLDRRIPTPLLSSTIAASTPTPSNLGKLADLRIAAAPSWRASPTPSVLKQSAVDVPFDIGGSDLTLSISRRHSLPIQ
ncbi:hypothetical protein D9615_004914 [Tricholomella constricta]|uniref:R3H domain-containing protein n=1 Tax=Tricholomella constricta TaxID=117010 RepID=A0A8H5HHU0_9AGAR|nr:hypothetical protein D9615_004914 [Tricholomella constricta]